MRKYFIESERIRFGIWNIKDIDLAKKLWGDKEVTKYISGKGYFSEEEIFIRLTKEIANQEKYKVQYWPIFMKDTNEFMGCCGLRPYDLEKNIYEVGIHILPQYWGKGIASEALNKVIEYAFEELKVSNLFAGHNPENSASKKLLTKVGFRFVREEYYEPTGLMHPSYLYKI